jgi:hypothetical protein
MIYEFHNSSYLPDHVITFQDNDEQSYTRVSGISGWIASISRLIAT